MKILPILSKHGLSSISALLLFLTIRPLNARKSPTFRVLVIEKAVFNEDVRTALDDATDIQLYGIGRAIVKCMALGILPRHICADDTYISNDQGALLAKAKYRIFLEAVWLKLQRYIKLDAVLTGNWAYWAERELGAVLESHNKPFIVLHKEGIKPPARSELLRKLFRETRGQFLGRRMLVYQDAERRHQIEGDITREDQISVVGMPRMDRIHSWRQKAFQNIVPAHSKKPLVLFLAFLPNNFLPSYSGISSDLSWDNLCSGTLRSLIKVADENPSFDILIRPREQELTEILNLINRNYGESSLPHNLIVSADGDVFDFLTRAWVIVGHNTTVLLEGLASGKKVIVPNFGEALDPRYGGYIVDIGAAAIYADSENHLVELISNTLKSPPIIQGELSLDSINALEHWTGNSDGKSAQRVQNAVRHELQKTYNKNLKYD